MIRVHLNIASTASLDVAFAATVPTRVARDHSAALAAVTEQPGMMHVTAPEGVRQVGGAGPKLVHAAAPGTIRNCSGTGITSASTSPPRVRRSVMNSRAVNCPPSGGGSGAEDGDARPS